ncbi:MAG: c-type cytochrome [Gemmataceae bacterium]
MLRPVAAVLLVAAVAAAAQPPKSDPPKKDAKAEPQKKDRKGKKDAPKVPAKPSFATPADKLKVAKGFKVELVYSVPRDTEGSWVSMCHDPKGRLVVSDQYGSLYRITPAPVGGDPKATKVEKLTVDIGMAQGLLYAFDALYVVVNAPNKGGLYRVTDTNGDDMPDKVELLRPFLGGGGEHGPHAVLKHPDGKRLTVVCGNQTRIVDFDTTRVPPHWGEDHLLPRVPDGNGFMKGVLAPGGFIFNCDPMGKNVELVSTGFRNEYDAAYNRDGELFTYDADMEWDYNTPWYRPTRVCHVTSGSEWGWRNGAGKYPVHYPDNLPPVVDIGPGSPTGVCFGYGAKFPAKYQDALFICDWSYGKLYAVHLAPKGSTYTATFEEFITGTPLPLTDLVVNPTDGALYFAVGGRKTQSGLYRVTYTGGGAEAVKATTSPDDEEAAGYRKLRHSLEEFHTLKDKAIADRAWQSIGDADRFVRYAARAALERQPVEQWQSRALAESNPQAKLTALLALVRSVAVDPLHAKKDSPKPDPKVAQGVIHALNHLDWDKLTADQRIELVRIYQILFNRFGKAAVAEDQYQGAQARLEHVFPTGNWQLDGMILETLVYMDTPSATAKALKLIADAPTQEEQLEYVRSLRMQKAGWTPDLRKQYFNWFVTAQNYKGGNSFQGFLRLIKADAVAGLTDGEKTALKPILEAKPATAQATAAPPRPFVQKWTLDELAPVVEKGLAAGGRDYDKGRKLFAAGNCFACHRYGNEGGANGPDLTGVAGRFNPRDLLESVLDPNKEISDQYAAVEIETADGRKVVGRIVNLNGDGISVNTDMLNPNGIVNVNRNNIEAMRPSKQSMMPAGLLDTFNRDEVLDLMAYLLSRGDRSAAVFKK